MTTTLPPPPPAATDLYLLTRRTSDYTEDHIILGVFLNRVKGLAAKHEYIAHMSSLQVDPHSRQAYMEVNLDKDVRPVIWEVDFPVAAGQTVFLLLETMEGFGQVNYNVVSIEESMDALLMQYRKEDEDETSHRTWPVYYQYDSVVVNQLRYENHFEMLR